MRVNTTKNQIIDAFFRADDMKEYLKTQNLSDADLFDIIAGSLTCLDCKLKWLKKAFPKGIMGRIDCIYRNKAIENLEIAINELELKSGEIFTLTDNWYDEAIHDEKKTGIRPYTRLSNVLEYINSEIMEALKYFDNYDDHFDACCWYTLDKWIVNYSAIE